MKLPAYAFALILAGCGSSTPGSDAPGSSPSSNSGAVAMPAEWKATDACAMIDRTAMSELLGKPVSETSLALVHEANGAEAATSECSYLFEDGSRASLMLRWSPIADNTEGAINLARNTLKQTAEAFGAKVDDVPGVGKAAFWVAKTDSLNAFIGGDKFLIVNTPSGPHSKEQAVAVARKLGA